MRILILADRRTGHVRQCLGLLRLIERERQVEAVELPLRAHRLAPEWVRRALAAMPGLVSADALLSHCYGLEPSDVSGFDLVIGSGRPTILAGLLISRLTGAKFIYCGRASGYPSENLDLVLTPYRGEALPGHIYAPIASPVDPSLFQPPRALRAVDALSGAHVALLIGGPSRRRGWSMPDWGKLAYFIVAAEHDLGVRWSIATSPRTPEAACGLLAATFSTLEHGEAFIDFHLAGPGSADALLGADLICVTSDSTNMIAEGLAAMRPVVGLQSRRLKASRDDRLLADLSAEGSFADLPIAELTPKRFAEAVIGLSVPKTDPRASLAAALQPVLSAIINS
jgi:mitochondrial fission protein ELM1